jgi:hypothetical protein
MVRIDGAIGKEILNNPNKFPNLINPVSGKLVKRSGALGKKLMRNLKRGGGNSDEGPDVDAVIILDNGRNEIISFYKNDAVLTDDERKKYDKALDWLKNCVRDKDRINIYNKKLKSFLTPSEYITSEYILKVNIESSMRVVIKGYDIFHRTFSYKLDYIFAGPLSFSPHYETYKLNRFSDVREPLRSINDKSIKLLDRWKYIKTQYNLPSEIEKRNFERMIFSITMQMKIEQSDHSDSDSDSYKAILQELHLLQTEVAEFKENDHSDSDSDSGLSAFDATFFFSLEYILLFI